MASLYRQNSYYFHFDAIFFEVQRLPQHHGLVHPLLFGEHRDRIRWYTLRLFSHADTHADIIELSRLFMAGGRCKRADAKSNLIPDSQPLSTLAWTD